MNLRPPDAAAVRNSSPRPGLDQTEAAPAFGAPGASGRSRRLRLPVPTPQLSALVRRGLGLLSNPYFLILSLLAGIYIGLFQKDLAVYLAPVAALYIVLLKMVLLPFMVSAIVVSLSRLFSSTGTQAHLGSIVALFLVAILAVSGMGVACAIILNPGGGLSASVQQLLGEVIDKSPYTVDVEIALNAPAAPPVSQGSLLGRLIPDNIFHALSIGDNLKILFFTLAFGMGLGSLRVGRGEGLRAALLSTYEVCTQIIAWVSMLLPVALCAMVASQVAEVGTAQLATMLKYTVGFSLISICVLLASVAVLALASEAGFATALRAAREPFLLAIATRSSITCIPSAVEALAGRLGYDRARVEAILPVGITLFRFGPVLYYAFSTVFAAQIYGLQVSAGVYVAIMLGAVLTGLASAGTTGILTISLLGIIFQPLGLPLEAVLALLVTIDPIIDILRTAVIVLANCAVVAVVNRRLRNTSDGGEPVVFRPQGPA